MKLSMRTRYGLRAILDLAGHPGPVSVRDIAGRQNISVRYLENILNDLAGQGLLTSTRGKGGGFSLAVSLDGITLLRLVEILEGPVAIVDCVPGGTRCPARGCLAREVWTSLNNKIIEALAEVTLAQVLDDERNRPPRKPGKNKER